MPKQRRILRHKKNAKRKVKVIKHEQQPKSELTEEDLKNIPPHMLDKIPAGAALKPSAATLHRMMMQQFAPMYNPMPFYTQQQQQATNMKNDNDIKEQAVNQAKQDMVVENERKRKIARQDAANKREAAREEHNIKMEKQELDQAAKVEQQKQHLERQNKELEYRKQLLDKDNEINQLNMKKDDMEAINRQIEHNIEMKRKQSKIDELQHKYDAVEQRNKELVDEYDALVETIDNYNSSPVKKKYKEMYTNNAKLEAENVILENVRKAREEAFIIKMKNQTYNDDMNFMYTDVMQADLQKVIKELADQKDTEASIKRKIERVEFLEGKAEQIWQEQQNQELENARLNKLVSLSTAELPSDSAVEAATKEMENKQKQQEIDNNISLQRKIVESKVAQGQLDYLKSKQSEDNMKLVAQVESAIEQENIKANELKKTAKLYKDAKQQQILNTIKKDVNNIVIAGAEPAPKLWEGISTSMSTQEQNVHLQVTNDEYIRANQSNDNYRRMQERIRAVYDSNTPDGQTFREWAEASNVDVKDLNEAGLVEMVDAFKQATDIDLLRG